MCVWGDPTPIAILVYKTQQLAFKNSGLGKAEASLNFRSKFFWANSCAFVFHFFFFFAFVYGQNVPGQGPQMVA